MLNNCKRFECCTPFSLLVMWFSYVFGIRYLHSILKEGSLFWMHKVCRIEFMVLLQIVNQFIIPLKNQLWLIYNVHLLREPNAVRSWLPWCILALEQHTLFSKNSEVTPWYKDRLLVTDHTCQGRSFQSENPSSISSEFTKGNHNILV